MNLSENARELELEESEYRALLEMFHHHLESDVSALQEALHSSDLNAVYQAAHSIKGASGSLNLWSIYEAASEICSHANEGTAGQIGRPLSAIETQRKVLAGLLGMGPEGSSDGP